MFFHFRLQILFYAHWSRLKHKILKTDIKDEHEPLVDQVIHINTNLRDDMLCTRADLSVSFIIHKNGPEDSPSRSEKTHNFCNLLNHGQGLQLQIVQTSLAFLQGQACLLSLLVIKYISPY